MSKNSRLNKLEDIEHAYFCDLEDCSFCGGVNLYLQNAYGSEASLEASEEWRTAAENEIWKLKTDTVYPVYVLIVVDFGALKKCVRVSDFVDFNGDGDVLADGYLLECWNQFHVTSEKFASKVTSLNQQIMRKVRAHMLGAAKDAGKLDTAVEFFRDLEIQYQEHAVLLAEKPVMAELQRFFADSVDSVREQITKLGEVVVDFAATDPAPAAIIAFSGLHTASPAHGMLGKFDVVGKVKDIFNASVEKIGFGDEKVLFDLKNVTVSLELVKPTKTGAKPTGRIKIEQTFNLLPAETVMLHNDKTVDICVSTDDESGFQLEFPFAPGSYQLSITYLDFAPLQLQFVIRKR